MGTGVAVPAGMLTVWVGDTGVLVGGMVGVGVVVAGLQAVNRKTKSTRMDTYPFIRVLPLFRSCNLLGTVPKYYIL